MGLNNHTDRVVGASMKPLVGKWMNKVCHYTQYAHPHRNHSIGMNPIPQMLHGKQFPMSYFSDLKSINLPVWLTFS